MSGRVVIIEHVDRMHGPQRGKVLPIVEHGRVQRGVTEKRELLELFAVCVVCTPARCTAGWGAVGRRGAV